MRKKKQRKESHTFGVLQLYNAIMQSLAVLRNSKLFWSVAICKIFESALSAGGCTGNSDAVQYVVAKSAKNFNWAIFVFIDGVWAASQRILIKRDYLKLYKIDKSTNYLPKWSLHL